MLSARGGSYDVVKVLDFGLVKSLAADAGGDATRSRADAVTGTPAYMAPEAIARPTEVDGRTDLYAVGAVGYFLLAGAPVFAGSSTFELCGHHLHTAPTPPSVASGRAIPPDLEAIVLACLAKSAAERPQSARELRAQLLATAAAQTGFDEAEAARFWTELRKAREQRAHVPPARRVLVATREVSTPAST
jgi:serine/threonine-protein kinase